MGTEIVKTGETVLVELPGQVAEGTDLVATISFDHAFIIDPNVEGEGAFTPATATVENKSTAPLVVTAVSLAAKAENKLKVVAPDAFADWNALDIRDTAAHIALGYRGMSGGMQNGEAFFFEGEGAQTEHALFTLDAGASGTMTLQAKFGRAWTEPSEHEYDGILKLTLLD